MAIVPIDTVTPANTHITGTNHKLDRIASTLVPIEAVCTPTRTQSKPHPTNERLVDFPTRKVFNDFPNRKVSKQMTSDMSHDIDEDEARLALDTVEHRRLQVIAEIDVPRWYWWGLAGRVGGPRRDHRPRYAWVTLAATFAFGTVHSVVAQHVLSGRHGSRQLSVRRGVVGRHTPLVLVGLLVGLGAVTVGLALLAEADGAGHPVTMASVVVAVAILCGGPAVMAAIRRRARERPVVTTAARFDELIHPSTRLSIVALLASADWIDFAFVRDRLGLSDSALSKQFTTLEGAGYIVVERPLADRRRRVRVRLTDDGRRAFEGHVAALRAVVASAESASASF